MLYQHISVTALLAYLNAVGAAPVPAPDTNPRDLAPLYFPTFLVDKKQLTEGVNAAQEKSGNLAPLYSLAALVGPQHKRDNLVPLYSLADLVGPQDKEDKVVEKRGDLAPLYLFTTTVGPQEKSGNLAPPYSISR